MIGNAFTLNSIAAAVLGGVGFLGGTGTMRGALAGSLLLSVMINVMFFLGFPPVAQYVAQGLIIIGAVALAPARRDLEAEVKLASLRRGEAGRVLGSRPFLTLIVVVVVWIAASIVSQGFGSYGHLRYLVELAAAIGIVAAGQTLVVIGGGIDLSVGAVITVASVSLPLLSPAGDPTGLAGMAFTLALAAGIGFVNGAGIAYLRVHPLIMTLAMATLLQGLLVIIAGGSAVSVQNPLVVWFGSARHCHAKAGRHPNRR